MATTKEESLTYEISDYWWLFENLFFQQQWAYTGTGGIALVSDTQSSVTLGQSINGVQMNLWQMLLEVIYYVLYAAQGTPFPSTMNMTTLTAPAPPMTGPFQVGNIIPGLTSFLVPWFQVKNKLCSEIIELMLRFLPDTGKWFDYSTTPPTLNIDNLTNLTAKTIAVLNSNPAVGPLVSGWRPNPRYDLQVPAVILKYLETEQVNGQTEAVQIVDKAPTDAADNTIGALLQTIDLEPGHATYQQQAITTCDRPTTEADATATSWVTNNPLMFWLFGSVTYPSIYDTGGITVSTIDTTLDPNDPNNTTPQPGYSLNALTEQLLTGQITNWMIDNSDCNAAYVNMDVVLAYSGSDPTTMALFNTDSASPNTLRVRFGITATTASTGTYQQLTSFQQGEPAPIGNAAILFNILNKLHQDGTIELGEKECSGLLPVGCVFNASDGLAEWQNMDALILRVNEDIDSGKTTVRYGPMMVLGAQDLVELARAYRGIIPAFNLSQRTTGKSGGDGPVVGSAYSPRFTFSLAPGGGSSTPAGTFGLVLTSANPPTNTIFTGLIAKGNLFTDLSQATTIGITGMNAPLAVNLNDIVWIEATMNSTGTAVTSAVLKSYGSGGSWVPSTDIQIGGSESWLNYNTGTSGAYPDVVQAGFRVLIARVTAGAAGATPTVTQSVASNLALISYTAFDSTGRAFPAIYPIAV